MVVWQTGGGKPTENAVKSVSNDCNGGKYMAHFTDRAAVKGQQQMLTGNNALAGPTPYNGTYLENLGEILKAYKVPNIVAHTHNIDGILQTASGTKPIILHITWTGTGASHAVLVIGYDKAAPKGMIVLDPAYGLQVMPANANSANPYETRDGLKATLNGWYCQVT